MKEHYLFTAFVILWLLILISLNKGLMKVYSDLVALRSQFQQRRTFDSTHLSFAEEYLRVGDVDKALHTLDLYRLTSPCGNVCKTLVGRTKLLQGKFVEALEICEKVPREDAVGCDAIQCVATALFQMNMFSSALYAYTSRLDCRPNDASSVIGAGRAMLALNKSQEAIELISEHVQTKPEQSVQFTELRIILAQAYVQQGDSISAIHWFSNVFGDSPHDDKVAIPLHELLSSTGNHTAALSVAKAFVTSAPKELKAYTLLASSLVSLNRFAEAIETSSVIYNASQLNISSYSVSDELALWAVKARAHAGIGHVGGTTDAFVTAAQLDAAGTMAAALALELGRTLLLLQVDVQGSSEEIEPEQIQTEDKFTTESFRLFLQAVTATQGCEEVGKLLEENLRAKELSAVEVAVAALVTPEGAVERDQPKQMGWLKKLGNLLNGGAKASAEGEQRGETANSPAVVDSPVPSLGVTSPSSIPTDSLLINDNGITVVLHDSSSTANKDEGVVMGHVGVLVESKDVPDKPSLGMAADGTSTRSVSSSSSERSALAPEVNHNENIRRWFVGVTRGIAGVVTGKRPRHEHTVEVHTHSIRLNNAQPLSTKMLASATESLFGVELEAGDVSSAGDTADDDEKEEEVVVVDMDQIQRDIQEGHINVHVDPHLWRVASRDPATPATPAASATSQNTSAKELYEKVDLNRVVEMSAAAASSSGGGGRNDSVVIAVPETEEPRAVPTVTVEVASVARDESHSAPSVYVTSAADAVDVDVDVVAVLSSNVSKSASDSDNRNSSFGDNNASFVDEGGESTLKGWKRKVTRFGRLSAKLSQALEYDASTTDGEDHTWSLLGRAVFILFLLCFPVFLFFDTLTFTRKTFTMKLW